MAFRRPRMTDLLAARRMQEHLEAMREVDRLTKEAVQEARARRDLGLERRGYDLKTKKESP